MTVNFRYFQYEELFMIIGFPHIIQSICYFIAFLFLFFSVKERKEESNKSEYLRLFTIIAMISVFIPLFFPSFSYISLTESEGLKIAGYLVIKGLVTSIPFFVASILLFLYSFYNRSKFDNYLLTAAILWLIYYGFSMIALNWEIGRVYKYQLHLEPGLTEFERLVDVYQALFNIILTSSFGFFIFHGIKNSDYKFIYAGLTWFMASSIFQFLVTLGDYHYYT
jgi:hypothetical protein